LFSKVTRENKSEVNTKAARSAKGPEAEQEAEAFERE
jgi:hypothetical protein